MSDSAKQINNGSFAQTIRMTLTTGGQLGVGIIDPKWTIHSAGLIAATSINPEGTPLYINGIVSGSNGIVVGLTAKNGDVNTMLGQVVSNGTNYGCIQVTSGGSGTGKPLGITSFTLAVQPGGGNIVLGKAGSFINVDSTCTFYNNMGVNPGLTVSLQNTIIRARTSTNQVNFINELSPLNTQYYINYGGGGDYKAYRWCRGFSDGQLSDSYAATHINVSDFRLKTDITYIENDDLILSKILNLKPIEFHWKLRPSEVKSPGFIAQDVETLFPLLITTSNTVVDNHGFVDEKSMNYSGLTPYLVSAIKSQNKTIASLEDRIARLELLLTKNNIQ